MSSHKDAKVNNKFEKWLQKKYGGHGKVKAHQGNKHNYLGMVFEYCNDGKVDVDMSSYIQEMIDKFSVKMKSTDTALTPASESLWNAGQAKALDKKRKDKFHSMVAKALFVAKRARPDIHPVIAVLCTRVKDPHEGNWQKLI